MRTFVRLALTSLLLAACSDVVGDTPTETTTPGTIAVSTTADPPTTAAEECVRVTGGTDPVALGSPALDAIYLSGESFICSPDVVVVGESDLNEVAAAAQLAAALGGPLLFPHAQLASELGRLKPERIHLVGEVEVFALAGSEIVEHGVADAVDAARDALGVSEEIRLPAVPDATTVVETVSAIQDRDRVVLPQTAPPASGTTPPTSSISEGEVVIGLAQPTAAEAVWLLDAGDPAELLMAAATGRSVGAVTIAYESSDILAYPEVGTALQGRTTDSLRYVGTIPDADEWQLAVLLSGQQVPGGGFIVFPDDEPRRFVAFYGHPATSALGVLGEQGPEETVERMQPFLDAYRGDGSLTIPTFEMLASVASAGPTDGDYSEEWPPDTFLPWIELAASIDGYVILDLQSGRDDFLTQAKQYEELLKHPNVGLALDPEWRLKPDQVHLKQVGSVDGSEVNLVVDWLADLVRENGLPQKVLLLHQFRTDMIQDRNIIKQRPEIQMIVQMDGDGSEPQKDDTYWAITRDTEDAFWRWGWKNFFDEDEPGPPSPESTMGKDPVPVYVSYQ